MTRDEQPETVAPGGGTTLLWPEFDMEVHWWPMPQTERGGYLSLCEEYVTGDAVIDGSTGKPDDVKASVTCTECLEWLHA